MEIKLKASFLTRACSVLRDYVSSKDDLGAYVRLSTEGGMFSLSGTDGTSFGFVDIPLELVNPSVLREGTVFVGSSSFLSLLNSVPEYAESFGYGCLEMHLDSREDGLHILFDVTLRSGALTSNRVHIPTHVFDSIIRTTSFTHHPKLPDDYLGFEASVLSEALGKTAHAMGPEEVGLELNKIQIQLSGQDLAVFTSTNGVKLVEAPIACAGGFESPIVVPSRLVRKLLNLSGLTKGIIRLYATKSQLIITVEDDFFVLSSPLPRSKLPDCTSFFEGVQETSSVSRPDFLLSVRNIQSLTDRDDSRLGLLFEKDALGLSIKGAVGGNSSGLLLSKSLSVPHYLEVNSNYLVDVLRTLKTDQVELGFFEGDTKISFAEIDSSEPARALVVALVRFE